MKPTNRNYRATFIVDNRGKEDSVDQIIDGVKKEIVALGGTVSATENLGKKDFIRVTDRKLTGAPYVHVDFSGDRKSTRLNSSHSQQSRMPSSA